MPAPRKPVDPTLQKIKDAAIFGREDWPQAPDRRDENLRLAWLGAREALTDFRDGVGSARGSGKYTSAGLAEKTQKLADAARARLADMERKVISHQVAALENLRAKAKQEQRGKLDPIEILARQLRDQEIRSHILSFSDVELMKVVYDARAHGDLETLQAVQGIPGFVRAQIPTFTPEMAQAVNEAVAELTISPATRAEIQALEEPLGRAQAAQAGVLKAIDEELGGDPLQSILDQANQPAKVAQ